MERNVTEEGICETNICSSLTKLSICPTPVEFVSAIEKKETDKCSHFSIRAYVADIRRTDWKTCWPFSSLGDSNEESKKQADMLPPLHAPEFRWWGCQNCLQRSDASDDAEDIRLVSNSSADKGCESTNSDVNTSVDTMSSEFCPMIHGRMKEKVANVMSAIRQDLFASGNCYNTMLQNVDKTIKEPNFCEMKDPQFVNGEVTKFAETMNLNLEGSGLVEHGVAKCGTRVVDDVVLKCANNSSTEVLQEEDLLFGVSKVAKTSEQVEEMTCHQIPELGILENKVYPVVGRHKRKLHPLESIENDDYKDAHDPSFGKPQKFRLLTDIIRSEVSSHFNTKVTQTKAADEPDCLDLVIYSGGRIAVQENVERVTGVKNKKRKTLQTKEPEPLQMSWSKSVSENARIDKKDQENNCFDSVIANSKSVEDAVVWEGLHSCLKSQYSEKMIDGKVVQALQGKKKHKKSRIEDREPYLKPWKGALCKELQLVSSEEESKGTGVGNLQLSNDGFTDRGLHSSLGLNLVAQESNKKSTFCMKESGIFEDTPASLIPLQECMQGHEQYNEVGAGNSPFRSAVDTFTSPGIYSGVFSTKATRRKAVNELQTNMALVEGDSSATYHDLNFRHIKTDLIPAKATQNRKSKKGLQTSANFCMASERNDTDSSLQKHKQEVPKLGSGKTPLIYHDSMPKEVRVTCNESSGRGARSGLKIKKATLRKANMSTKKNKMFKVQDGVSPMRSKDLSFIFDSKNKKDIQEHSEAFRNQGNERVGKTNGLESLNDIPIEIVELLAKNRHEKRRLEADNVNQNKFCMSETTKNVKDAGKIEFNGILEPQSRSAQGGIPAAGRSVGVEPVEESKAYSSHLKGSSAISFSQVNHSSRKEFAEAGSGKNFGVQSCRWDWDKLGSGWPISSLQCSASHTKHQTVFSPTRISKGYNVSLPNEVDDPLGIEGSQKFATLSKRKNIFKKINAKQPCACTQKKIGNYPNSVGPSDLYTNESIPATQLLKLMDAKMNSRISHNMDEKSAFTNQPSFPQCNHCKNLFPLNGGVLKDASQQSMFICFSKDHGGSRNAGQVSQKMVSDGAKSTKRIKRTSSHSLMQPWSGSGSGILGKNHESFPINGLQAPFHSPSNSMIVPLKSYLNEGSIVNVVVDNDVRTVGPVKGSCETEICSVNRNPADFTIPEAENEFMRGGGVLKCRRMVSKRGRPRLRMMNLLELKVTAQS